MSGFDYVVFVVVALAAIAGFFRGFVEEILALGAWCLALLAVHYGHAPLTGVLTPSVGNQTGAGIIAFAILLGLPYFGTKMLARRIGDASRGSVLGPVDRVLGFGFGAVKGFVVMVLAFSLLVFAYDVVWGPKGRPGWIRDGRTYPFLNAASDELMSLVSKRRDAAVKAARATGENAAEDAAGDALTHAVAGDDEPEKPARHGHHHHQPADDSDP